MGERARPMSWTFTPADISPVMRAYLMEEE